jgi:hypothetical protein
MRRCHFLVFLLLSTSVGVAAGLSPVRLKGRTFVPSPGIEVPVDGARAPEARQHFLLQLRRPRDRGDREALEALGIRLLRYVPDDTWLASGPPAALDDPEVRELVAWAGPLRPEDKVPPRFLEGRYGAWARQPDGQLAVRVRLHDDVAPEALPPLVEDVGGEWRGPLAIFPGGHVVMDPEAWRELAARDEILWISEEPPRPAAENDGIRLRVGADSLQAPPWDLSGSGVRIGIWDSGLVDADHDDFADRIFLGESGMVSDHATHVAGTMGGSGLLSQFHGGDSLQWRGMAPEVELYSWDFYGDVIQEMADGLDAYAFQIENNSWGFLVDGSNCDTYGDYDLMAPELDALVRGAAGRPVVIVFSAGNERNDGDCPLVDGGYGCINPPKAAKNIIVVGATNSDDDTMTDFSSWGPVDDGRLKPDLVAPGCERGGEGYIHSTLPGDNYGGPGWCGTSMAAPTVSGCLALLYELWEGMGRSDPPEPSLMKALLVATAVDLGNPGPDYAYGHGRLWAPGAAVALTEDTPVVVEVDQGEVYERSFPVPAGRTDLRFVLAWDDPDAAPFADPALVNDLDLELEDPEGGIHYPWILDPDRPTFPAVPGQNHRDNVEHLRVLDPMAGQWTVRVRGTNVPQGPQRASLVGLDENPPESPSDFRVENVTSQSAELRWTNAPDGDREGTLIVRSQGNVIWLGPQAGQSFFEGQVLGLGILVIYVRDEDHSADPLVDTGLQPGLTYTYSAYTFDDMHNFSAPAVEVVTTPDASAIGEVSFSDGPTLVAQPQLARGSVEIRLAGVGSGRVLVRILGPDGREVARLLEGAASDPVSLRWTPDPRRPSGIYFLEARAGDWRGVQRILRLK